MGIEQINTMNAYSTSQVLPRNAGNTSTLIPQASRASKALRASKASSASSVSNATEAVPSTCANTGSHQRIRYIDIAKALAMFAIISGHFGVVSINNVVYGFHVPLFFIVSGYFFSTKRALTSSIVQKLRQLMIPYVIVGLVYIPVLTAVLLLQHSDKQTIVANISKIPLALLYGAGVPVHSPAVLPQIGLLWFLPALCFAFIFVYIALKTRHAFLIIVLYFMIGWISMLFFHAPLSIQPALMGTFFIYIGYKARQYDLFNKRAPLWLIVLMVCLCLSCISSGIYVNIVNGQISLGPLSILHALCFSYLIIRICQWIDLHNNILAQFLQWCGKGSLIMMCFHGVSDYCFPGYLLQEFLMNWGLSHAVATAILIMLNMVWAVLGVVLVVHCKPLARLFSAQNLEKISCALSVKRFNAS